MKKIIIDIDGVACDHAGSICNWVNEEYGLNVTPSSVTSWDHDFGPITFVAAVRECYPKYDFIQSMKVSNGFMEFYQTIRDKVAITFATARDNSQQATADWIEDNFPGETVVFTPQKALLEDHGYLIDDYYEECIGCADLGMVSLLLKQPWNDTLDVKGAISQYGNIIHCASFRDALGVII